MIWGVRTKREFPHPGRYGKYTSERANCKTSDNNYVSIRYQEIVVYDGCNIYVK